MCTCVDICLNVHIWTHMYMCVDMCVVCVCEPVWTGIRVCTCVWTWTCSHATKGTCNPGGLSGP